MSAENEAKTPDRDPSTLAALLRAHPNFARLPAATIEALLRRATLGCFPAGHVLIQQDAPSDAAYLLLDGEVDIEVETTYGPVHLARRGANTLLGELGAFAALPRTATVRAI